jgi:phage tail protein X
MGVYKNSRYTLTPPYVRNETLILGTRERATFNPENCSHYTFVVGDTVDGIAYRQYGNPALWWAIMDANRQYQSELEIKPGDLLVIPSFEEVVQYV